MDSWLQVERLEFGFGESLIFDELSFEIPEESRVLVVVGPSGVGKTTLIKLLAGHLTPSKGHITICDERVEGPSAQRPVVFQDYGLFPWQTVLQNVCFGLRCAGYDRSQRQERGRELLASLRLEGTDSLLPRTLSGGMQQRVALARALAVSPRSILLDEPFSALDSEIKRALCLEVSRMAAIHRTHLVVVTHDLRDAAFLADCLLVLRPELPPVLQANQAPPHPRRQEFLDSDRLRQKSEELRQLFPADLEMV